MALAIWLLASRPGNHGRHGEKILSKDLRDPFSVYFRVSRGYKVLALLIQPQRCKLHASSGAVEPAGLTIDGLARGQLWPQVGKIGDDGLDSLDYFGIVAALIVRQLIQARL